VTILSSARGGDGHRLGIEVDRHRVILQRVDPEQPACTEVDRADRGRLDRRAADDADFQRGDDDGADGVGSGHAGDTDGAAGREAERGRELARDDGALGSGVDDEGEWSGAGDRDRDGHAGFVFGEQECGGIGLGCGCCTWRGCSISLRGDGVLSSGLGGGLGGND
jgi:hypothetical protein